MKNIVHVMMPMNDFDMMEVETWFRPLHVDAGATAER
jgi:hypothetical protein